MRGKSNNNKNFKADPKFSRTDLSKFINYIMKDGKKTIAQDIVYTALEDIKNKTQKDPIKVFEDAIKAVSPQMEVRSKRVGGANYQVPMPVRGNRQFALACRWIIKGARDMKGKTMAEKLSQILVESIEGTGSAIKKRDEVHRMAEANKAFAHFARFAR